MWLFLISAIMPLVYVSALKCYTCGGIEDQDCSSFQIENPRFSRECDNSSRSCRIAWKVNENLILSRSCEPLKMDDCKIANSIEFCYCTKDLCNLIRPLNNDDDEDEEEFLEEGSGRDTIIITSTTEKMSEIHRTSTKMSSNCSKIRSDLCLVGIIIIFSCIISWF